MDLIHSCYLLILERVFTLICKKIEIGDRESKEFGYREIVWRDDYKYDFAIFVPYAIEFKKITRKSWSNGFAICWWFIGIFFIFDDIGMRGDYMKKVAHKKYQKNIFDERFTLESSGPFAFQEYHFRGPPSNLYTLSLYIPPSLLTPSLFLSLISFAVKLFRPSFRNFFKQCKY